LGKEEAENATIELPQSVLELVYIVVAFYLPPVCKQSVDDECVECDDQNGPKA
jgi:hypothetical protein